MSKIQVIRCSSCGSNSVKDLGNGVGKCNHCESTMLMPSKEDEIISLLNSAYIYRENFNYDLAIKSYQYIIEKSPKELSAYEGLLLSEYGIEYVKDVYTGKLVPTCHRAHFKSILEDSNYNALLTIASPEQKEVIEQKAKEIDKLQKAIERQLKNEPDFDVFISYKTNDNNGEKSEDSIIARNIYEELTNKNYRVFFAEKTLEDRLGSEYEPIIFKALHTAKIFILVGTKKENIESNWVRNEWSRFIDRIKNEPQTLSQNSFIPVFKDMSPYDMPKVNNNFVQGVDASKLGYSITVLDGVQKILKPEKEKKVLEVFDNVENMLQFEKIRKQKTIEAKRERWKDLQTNPKNKKKKFWYNFFLCLPYIFFVASCCFACNRASWFPKSGEFFWFMLFNFLLLLSSILVCCIHRKKYSVKLIYTVVFPFVMTAVSLIITVCCLFVIKVGTRQESAVISYGGCFYHKGLIINSEIFNSTKGQFYLVYVDPDIAEKYFTVEQSDGKKALILPETFNGINIYYGDKNSYGPGALTVDKFKNIDYIVIPEFDPNF